MPCRLTAFTITIGDMTTGSTMGYTTVAGMAATTFHVLLTDIGSRERHTNLNS